MIAGLRGVVAAHESDAVLMDVQGVIYRAFVPSSLLSDDALRLGVSVSLHTYHIVREDAVALYGFQHPGDLMWFRTLLGVTGVGPRVALAMLSRFSGDELLQALQDEDVTALASVPGIGRKTASRIVLDLRGKLPASTGAAARASTEDSELIEVLEGLGYSRAEATLAAAGADVKRTDELETRLLAALRELSLPSRD